MVLPGSVTVGETALAAVVSHGVQHDRAIGDGSCDIVEIDDRIGDFHDDNSILIGSQIAKIAHVSMLKIGLSCAVQLL